MGKRRGLRNWEARREGLRGLDEDSLKAARESKDPAMVAKITRLWNEQNDGR